MTLYPRDSRRSARVADYRGRVVLVNFWATWCPPCRAEMPDLNRLSDEYRQGPVAILAITDETPDRIALYERKITPLRMTVATFQSHPPAGAISRAAYSGRPATVIIDREGRVREMFIGIQTYNTLKAAIGRYL